jgi:methyl-accepting chemotaxis protein
MFHSVRAKVLLASLSTLVVSLLVNAALNYEVGVHYNSVAIAENLSALEDAHASAIADWVNTRAKMVESLRDAAFESDPLPALRQIAKGGGFANASIGWADKRYLQTSPVALPPGYDPTVRPWYRQAIKAGTMVVTKPYADLLSGKLAVAFATPVVKDGVAAGVLSASVYMDSVKANIQSIHPTPNSFGALVDGDGWVIAYPDAKLIGTRLSTSMPALGRIADAADVAPQTIGIDGVAKVARAQRVAGTDWRLIVVLDEAEANAAMRSQMLFAAIALLAIVVIAALIMSMLTAVALRRLGGVRDAMVGIASGTGDLTLRLPAHGRDEIAGICEAFNQFVEKLLDVMRRVRDNSDAVRSAAIEIAAGNLDLSNRTESAAASVGQISASVERIVAMIQHSTGSAGQANAQSRHATGAAAKGGDAVVMAAATMTAIETASRSISDITGVINSIAFQTNILALNAAVEAARAGEGGRGFAVVANEVRELATRSALAAKEIKLLIDGTARSVESGVAQVHFVGDTVKDIVRAIGMVATIIDDISSGTDGQKSGIAEVKRAIASLDEVVQQNAALVEESAAAADSLKHQADSLSGTVSQFKLD